MNKKIILFVLLPLFLTVSLTNHANAEKIPPWIGDIFGWYSQGSISESEMIRALQFLIDMGILNMAPIESVVTSSIFEELAKPDLLFHTDKILTGNLADEWIHAHTTYMTTGDPDEMIRKLESHNGEYYFVVISNQPLQEYIIIDTDGNEVKYYDNVVIPVTCENTIYSFEGIGIGEMYLMYNDVTINVGENNRDRLQGLCRD